jgi:hypothetical protein
MEGHRHWEYVYTLAHLRGNLMQVAHDHAEDLRCEGIQPNRENLRTSMMFAIANARPRSSLIPWDLSDRDVERMLDLVVDDYLFGGWRKAA